jgi:hypothetical protein
MADTGTEQQADGEAKRPAGGWLLGSGWASDEPAFVPLTGWRDELNSLGVIQEMNSRQNLTLFLYAAGAFAALKILGPMAEAFATKLGENLGESALAAARRVRLRFKKSNQGPFGALIPDALTVEAADAVTTVILPADLTDEARIALIDLDITADGIRGKTLYWNPTMKTWGPAAKEM